MLSYARAAILAFALTVGAGAAHAQFGESVAAVVNDEVISTYDVRQRANLLLTSTNAEVSPELRELASQQALRMLIDEKLELQEARQFEIEIPPEEIEETLGRIAAQSGEDLESNLQALRDAGVSPDTLRDQVRATMAWDTLVQGRYGRRVTISDTQIEEAMRALAESLQETQYRVAEIFLEVNEANPEGDVFGEAQLVIEQLRQGAGFPQLARQFSDSPSSERGGDTGFRPIGEFPTEIAQMVQQMPVGGVSQPVRSLGGYYILALIEKREPGSAEQLTLKAIVLPTPDGATPAEREEARARLHAATREQQSCDAADTAAAGIEGAFVSDLGTLAGSALQPQMREAISGVEPGQATPAILSQLGAQVFLLCDRQIGGPGLPSRNEIAARMEDQRRSTLARRYLRDLHREASIEIR